MTSQWPLSGFGVELSPITFAQLEKIRAWRNHPEVAAFMLDKSHISKHQQQAWFASLAEKKQQVYLVISYKGEDIGVIYATSLLEGGNRQPKDLSLAKMISPGLYIAPNSKYKNSILAFSPSLVFIDYLFKQGCCQCLQAQVFNHNNSAIRYNEMLGYQQDDVDEQGLITMTLSSTDFNLAKAKLGKILRFN
jgi:UDP-4-amino-4,6-dideoxy-N-acetyl-beta-L-altrosamine N-acetyltransferase